MRTSVAAEVKGGVRRVREEWRWSAERRWDRMMVRMGRVIWSLVGARGGRRVESS